MSFIFVSSLRWYLKSFSKLPISEIFNKIATKGQIEKKLLRSYERITIKLAHYKLHLKYFDKCLELGLVPEFLKFKPPNLEAYQHSNILYQKVVKQQRKIVIERLQSIRKEHQSLISTLQPCLSVMQFRLLSLIVTRQVQKSTEEKLQSHNKKLYNLWKSNVH